MMVVKDPIHDSDLQSQPQFPTATSTKFPAHGLQQPQPPPQLAGRCCGCCWSEFSDIWWAIWSSEARSDIVTIIELRFNWERLNRSVAACVGRPSTATATAIWLHIAVAIENRCPEWGPLKGNLKCVHIFCFNVQRYFFNSFDSFIWFILLFDFYLNKFYLIFLVRENYSLEGRG